MKKLLTLTLATLGILSLSGCNLLDKAKEGIENVTGEKEMTCQEFLDYWAANGEKYEYTSALETDKSVSPKVQKSYTRDAEKHLWSNAYTVEVDGETFNLTLDKYFDAYYFVEENLKKSFKDKDMDETFKFTNNTKDNTYKISYKASSSDQAYEAVFDKDGLLNTLKGKGSSKEIGTFSVDFLITYQK